MSIEGVATNWAGVIEDQAPVLVKLVAAAWKRTPPGAPDEREDTITARLCLELQRSRTARKLMFYVHTQIVELDAETGDEFGRMDIGFYPTNQPWVPREDVYFCVECKRLNVIKDGKPRPYASEYVTLGVARFATGQYARAVQHGCMVGYVRDGNIADAIGRVDVNIRTRWKDLLMIEPGGFIPSSILARSPAARETHHWRSKKSIPFRIHHLFMPGDPKIAAAALASGTPLKVKKGKKKAGI